MKTFIGIDLGTSAVKLLLTDEKGRILASVSEKLSVDRPRAGYCEQDPADWFAAVDRGMKRLLRPRDCAAVRGVSFAGQMHGLVALDGGGNVIRPCILWNDARTEKQTEYLNDVIGKEKLAEYTANIAFAGFTAPKLLWLKENEPNNFKRIAKIMLPKDYLVYRFTGEHTTDYSDAAGTLLLDVKNRRWSGDMLRICSVKEEWLPRLCESGEAAGVIKKELAARWGLGADVTVAAGAGDNAAAAVGTGTLKHGACNISLGTSGTVFMARDDFTADGRNALHAFCHANGGYCLLGCILSAASCNGWWAGVTGENVKKEPQYTADNGVYFLPYLSGERSPHNDINAAGAFIGLRHGTTRAQMTAAVMEGVAFALKDCVEAAERSGVHIASASLCGGGAKSRLWRQISADVLNVPITIPAVREGPAYGAAMLAAVACGVYKSAEEAAEKLVRTEQTVYPDKANAARMQEKYKTFARIYPALKDVFKDMSQKEKDYEIR